MSVPVLFIHGFGSSFEHGWRLPGWVDLLAHDGREIIPYDLPGHGSRVATCVPDDYADIAGQLLASLDRPVDIISFSTGARVALRMAFLDPSSIRRLVLIAAGDTFMMPYDPEPLAAAILAEQPTSDRRLRTFHRLARSNGNSVEGMVSFLRRPDLPVSAEMLAAFAIPTLLITGGRDASTSGTALRSALADITHIEFAECDHFSLPTDQRTMAAARAFVNGAEGG